MLRRYWARPKKLPPALDASVAPPRPAPRQSGETPAHSCHLPASSAPGSSSLPLRWPPARPESTPQDPHPAAHPEPGAAARRVDWSRLTPDPWPLPLLGANPSVAPDAAAATARRADPAHGTLPHPVAWPALVAPGRRTGTPAASDRQPCRP